MSFIESLRAQDDREVKGQDDSDDMNDSLKIEVLIMQTFPKTRLRRLRENSSLRNLLQETQLSMNDVILPLFVKAGKTEKQPIISMPGHFQLSLDDLDAEIAEVQALGIPGVILFGIPENKDNYGSAGYIEDGIIPQAVQIIRQIAAKLLVITDVCLCEYTSHGHCGLLAQDGKPGLVDNDSTLELLAKQALTHVQAGADIVAPSGMMDGMVGSIRQALDAGGFQHIPILSYAVKYASALYGPFREAAQSAPSFGDRRGYQMNSANGNEALREAELDLTEGADMLMVKPAGAYLDVVYRVKQKYPGVPLAAYQVSGEYAMIKAAAAQGWLAEEAAAMESLLAIKRAGADFIISYFAKQLATWLKT